MKNGIDISSHQGTVDWKKVTADFVIIRAGWSWYEGGMNIDKRFQENAAGVQGAGIPWGAYLYAYDRTPAAARIAAGRLADLLDGYQLAYPVAYDFEDNQYLSMGKAENTAICRAFLETLQGRGYYAMLYTYTNFAKNYLDMEALSAYDLWIADYTGKVGWTGPYGMWQYSGSGAAPGIGVAVDLDRAYKDYPYIIREAGLNGYGMDTEDGDGELSTLRAENLILRQQVEEAEGKIADIRRIVGE